MQGQVLEVSIIPSGDELDVAHAAGATTLQLTDVSEFDSEGGGSLRVDSIDGVAAPVDYDYDTVDTTLNTVHILTGLAADAEEGRKVFTLPLSEEKWAKAEIQDDDDTKLVRVAHYLQDRMEDGVREPEDQETVVIEMVDGDLTITNIIDEITKVDAGYQIPGTAPTGSGGVPASSPTPDPESGPAAVIVRFDRPDDSSEVDLYVAASNTDPIDATTLHSTNVTSPSWISTYPDGSILPSTADSYFALVARNGADAAAPSAWVPARPGQVDPAYMLMLAGTILATRLGGQTVEGMVLKGGRLEIDNAITAYPGFMDIIAQQLNAMAATFNDNVTILGQNNKLAGGLELGTGVGNPTSKVTVTTSDWTTKTYPSPILACWGVCDNVAGTEHLAITNLESGTNSVVYRIRKTDGVVVGSMILASTPKTSFAPSGGMCRIGNILYVLGYDTTRASDFYVYMYDLSQGTGTLSKTGEWRVFGTQQKKPAIGTYNGEIIIAWMNASLQMRWRTFTPATGAQTRDITAATVYPDRRDIWAVGQQGTAANMWVWIQGYSPGAYTVDATSRIFAEDFTLPASNFYGVYWDGTRMHGLALDKVHTGSKHPGGAFDYGWTQVDSDLGGLGVAETMISPLLTDSAIVGRFKRPTITIPAPADDGTNDGANTGAVYAAPSGSTLRRQAGGGANLNSNNAGAAVGGELIEPNKKITLDFVDTTATLPAPPTANGFATRSSSAPGYFWSTPTSADGRRLIDVRGDGTTPRIRNLRSTPPFVMRHRGADVAITTSTFTRVQFNTNDSSDPTGTITVSNGGATFTVTRAGRFKAHAQLGYATGATGRRIVQIRVNGNAVTRRAVAGTMMNASQDSAVDITKDLILAVNDTVEIWTWQNQGTDLNLLGEIVGPPLEVITYLDLSYVGDVA